MKYGEGLFELLARAAVANEMERRREITPEVVNKKLAKGLDIHERLLGGVKNVSPRGKR